MTQKLLICIYLKSLLLALLFVQNGSGQIRQNIPRPVIKDGKFFFYAPSFRKDTAFIFHKLPPDNPPCKCTINAPVHKESIVSGGPLVLYITSTDATCGYGSGSIIVEVANGTAPYTFTFTDSGFTNPSQNTGNFPVVGSGLKTITVTDANGATATTDVLIKDILPGPVIIPVYITKTPSNCFNADGEFTLQPFGGTSPYTYSLDLINFQASNVFSNLNAGIYTIYVKDSKGCIESRTVFLLNGLCDPQAGGIGGSACGNDASLDITDLGQNGPYQYSLDNINYQNSINFYNLSAGIIKIYIKDKDGNIKIFGTNIVENCALNLQYIAVDAACQKNNGAMTITGANGTPPYTYTLDGINYQSSNVFTNVSPGNYYVTVKDATGQKSSLAATVYDKCPAVRAVTTGETCAKNDGTITAAGFKGIQPYEFSIDGINFQANNVFTGLKTGSYIVTLRDAFGFTDTTHVMVAGLCLNLSITTGNSTCSKKNGKIIVSAGNGLSPYTYSVDGVNFQSSNTINNLAAGNYVVTVKDSSGVTGAMGAIVSNTPGAKVNAAATAAGCVNNDGTITAINVGGTAPFQFAIDGITYQSNGNFNNVDTGMKRIYIKDGNGCVDSQFVMVPLNDNLMVDAGNGITICEGTGTNLKGTSNGVSFLWSPSLGLSNNAILNPNASPQVNTKYYLIAKTGVCVHTDSVNVFVNPAPVANAGNNSTVCTGKSVQLNGSGGSLYQWSPATYLNDPQISNPVVTQPQSSITYSLTVTDINGCKSLQPVQVTVTVTPAPKVFAGNDTAILINQSLRLEAFDVNNSGFTNYMWSPSSGLNNASIQNPTALITKDITYTVTASTPAGCEGTDNIAIKVFTVSNIFVPNAFTPNNDGLNDILKAMPTGIKEFKYFTVYNQWGQQIFYTTNAINGWDGTFHSKPQDPGVFVWTCAGIDYSGKLIQRKGTVVLIR